MNRFGLIFIPSKSPGVTSAKLWVKGGSRADPINQKGAHQLLGAVLSRGCGPYNEISLADLVEGCGAGLRCDVSEDGLLISLKCAERDALELIPIIGWMISDPHLEGNQVLLEKELSLQALQRQKENSFHLAFDGWRNLAYGKGPYGHDPLGIKDDLLQIGRKELIPLANQLRQRPSTLVIAGTINKELEEKIHQTAPFNSLLLEQNDNSKEINKTCSNFTNEESISNLKILPEATSQIVIMLGQATIAHGHKDDLGLRLINCHLSSGMSSLLFRRLREEHGVAYDVGVHHPTREKNAPFVMHASTSEEKALLTLKLLLDSWRGLVESPLSENDLSLAKAKYEGQIAHSIQTSSQRAERQAILTAFDLPIDYDLKCNQAIKKLNGKNLQDIASRHLKKPLLSLCGPKGSLERLANYWLDNID
ncbi:pitrilysin family protein [Prochlorococcus sp. MIT 1341]|uniref:M16 family metallopeptidase n=1 Tax=Prochlorococcus sp. MIT 1341 TaxID=3096221 RepID=UPI002A75A7C5|nr:pitrilysin family protein [Prochlorococcus sp. MIT 1341]